MIDIQMSDKQRQSDANLYHRRSALVESEMNEILIIHRSKWRGRMFLRGQHEHGDDQRSRDEHLYEHALG